MTMTRDEIEKLLDGTTPGPWFLQDFTAPEVNDDPMAGDVYVSCTWPDHICVASMGGGFHGYKALEQARADAAAIATWPDLARTALALHQQLADAEAAQAAFAERAVAAGADIAERPRPDGFPEEASNAYHSGAVDVVDAIRALAPDTGVKALAELRAERDALKAAVEGLIAVLDRNDKKGPVPDVEMMFCWLAAQDVRAAFRKIAPKGDAT